uniref:Uncharacterized protein n=1 Tax=Anguilla anguilla TaxID=7936 RepID=A0A0E9V301_ANGAN
MNNCGHSWQSRLKVIHNGLIALQSIDLQ